MRSVKERIENWEAKNHVEEVTTNPAQNQLMSSLPPSSNLSIPLPNRQSVVIENRLTEMEEARKLLEAMQIKTNNSNLIPGMLPPRQSVSRNGQPRDDRTSTNRMTKMKNPEDSTIPGAYEKQFLNIRGTINLDVRNEPPAPRNTVDVNYDSQVRVRESIARSANRQKGDQSQKQPGTVSPHGGYFRPLENSQQTMKSEVIKIDKGVHYRTQKIINSLFGEEEYDEFGYVKSQSKGAIRMTNPVSLEGSVPKFRSEGIPLKGAIKNKKHHENFDNL